MEPSTHESPTIDPAGTPPPPPARAAPLTSEQPQPGDLGRRPNVETTHRAARGVRLAQGMGWFSVGLGLTQLIAPRTLGKLIGLANPGPGMRLLGLRELATGVALLTGRRAAWLTGARLAGDVIDLGLLSRAMADDANDRYLLTAATAAVLGAAAIDTVATVHLAGEVERQETVAKVTHVGKAITIDAPASALYEFWRDLRNMPQLFEHVTSVESDGVQSRWVAEGVAGTTATWSSEIVDDQPNQRIAWRTVDGPFESSGSVRFLVAPDGRTEVVVDMHYTVPGGVLGKAALALSGRAPGLEVVLALARLKQLHELGEVMRSDASEGAL